MIVVVVGLWVVVSSGRVAAVIRHVDECMSVCVCVCVRVHVHAGDLFLSVRPLWVGSLGVGCVRWDALRGVGFGVLLFHLCVFGLRESGEMGCVHV